VSRAKRWKSAQRSLRERACASAWKIARAAALLPLLVGCSRGDDAQGTDAQARNQVAARVNGREITVHQINVMLDGAQDKRAANTAPAPRSGGAALDRLIEQEVLVQAASAQMLDRDPNVLAAMEDARREALARAYLEKVSSTRPEPTDAEVHDYYLRNPLLFRNRKVYAIREVAVRLPLQGDAATPSADLDKAAQARMADAHLREDLARELPVRLQALWERNHDWSALSDSVRGAGLRFESRSRIEAAEDLPLDQVMAFDHMNKGSVRIRTDRGMLIALQVTKIAREPLDEARATPMIRAYLREKSRERAERGTIERLTKTAQVERIGMFASTDGTPLATKSGINQ
jgi:EpsD family peptidyl-prolyl cis-trans isomerase